MTIEIGLVPTTGGAALIELVLAVALRVTIYHIALFYIISKSEVTWSYLRSTDEFSTNTIGYIEQEGVDRHKTAALHEDWHSSARSTPSRHSANAHPKVETAIEMNLYRPISYFITTE